MKNSYISNLDCAIDWIVESNIQSECGGFYAWYNCEENRYSFIYPEITGYAIRLLLQLYDETKKIILLNKAILAGDWLLRIQRPKGSFYSKYFDHYDLQNSNYCDKTQYVFDTGIISTALSELFLHTAEIEYLNASKIAADWIINLQNNDNSIAACLHPIKGLIENSHWSETKCCHQIKTVIAFLKMYEITKEVNYLNSAKKLLNWGINLQLKTGRFKISNKTQETYMHAHCYATEGLLAAAEYLKNESLLSMSLKSARWLSQVQNQDGSMYNWYNTKNNVLKVSDVTAQATRIWIILNQNGLHNFDINIQKSLNFLNKMQCIDSYKKNEFGGLYYAMSDETKIKHINSWATMFYIQSLFFIKNNHLNMIDKLI